MLQRTEQRMSRLIIRSSRLHTIVILTGGLLIQTIIMTFFSLFWWKDVSESFRFGSLLNHILLLVILAPVLETLIVQYGIIDFTLTKFKSNTLAIILSAVGFGLFHYYSAQYMVATFFSGILFAFIYLIFKTKNGRPILFVSVLHALYNLFLLIMKHSFE